MSMRVAVKEMGVRVEYGVVMGEKQEFIDYLREKSPDEAVGFPALGNSCPLAQWLQSRYGIREISVGIGAYFANGVGMHTPVWADEFQERAMHHATVSNEEWGLARQITASDALAIMESL